MNTEDFCSNCKSFFGHIKYPVLLNCCQKNICNLCYRKLIDSKSLECIECNDPNFSGAPNLEKNKVLFLKLFNQTEKKLDELHVKVYDAKWKNIVKAIKFYTNQSDYWPVEKTDRYDLSILRKIYESLTSEQEDKIKVFLRRFHSILKGIKNQKEKIASSSLETITKDIESFQDFFDEINIFMSQSFIKPFSDSDIELRLNEEKLERQNNIDFCFRVILDLKQLMNQAFERKVHKIQSYLIFLKNLFEALRPLLSIKKFQHNSLETDPKLMTLSNQDLFIYDFLVNKIKSTQKQLREYYNEQQKITNLLNSEYEKLLNCKNNEIRLYDERELTKLEKIVNTFLSIKPCRDLSFSYIDDARRNFEFFDEIYLVCDYSDFVQTINKDDPSVKIKNLVKNFKNSKGCFKCPTISQFQILKHFTGFKFVFFILKLFTYAYLLFLSIYYMNSCEYKYLRAPMHVIIFSIVGLILSIFYLHNELSNVGIDCQESNQKQKTLYSLITILFWAFFYLNIFILLLNIYISENFFSFTTYCERIFSYSVKYLIIFNEFIFNGMFCCANLFFVLAKKFRYENPDEIFEMTEFLDIQNESSFVNQDPESIFEPQNRSQQIRTSN